MREMPPLVTVVTKEDIEKLPAVITAAVASRALATINEIEQHVATVLTEHMWNELLAPNWAEYTADGDTADIAQVLLSRLARILDDEREQANASHPSHRYVYPPASTRRAPGSIYSAADQTWWVTLTPACDFAQSKVEFVLIAQADPLESNARYQKWAETKSRARGMSWSGTYSRRSPGSLQLSPSVQRPPGPRGGYWKTSERSRLANLNRIGSCRVLGQSLLRGAACAAQSVPWPNRSAGPQHRGFGQASAAVQRHGRLIQSVVCAVLQGSLRLDATRRCAHRCRT